MMRKTIWICGLLSGALITSFMVGTIASAGTDGFSCDNLGTSKIVGFSAMFIAFSVLFIGVKRYRDKNFEGTFSFGKGFLMSLYMSLIATGIYVGGWMSYTATETGSDWGEQYKNCMIDDIKANSELSDTEKTEKVNQMAEQMEMYKNPLVKIGFTTIEILPVA